MKFFKESPISLTPNLFSKGTKIVGNVNSEGNIRIDDNFKGIIKTTGDVIIGHFGVIEGDVICSHIEISGSLKGRILAKTLKLKSTAVVYGDILASKIEVEAGSLFSGYCKMEEITETTQLKRKRKPKKMKEESEQISQQNLPKIIPMEHTVGA